MVRNVTALLALFLVASHAAADDPAVVFRPRVCMIEDRVKAEAGLPVEVGGKTYYGCCPDCKGALEERPERYTKAIDPVTGNEVDKTTAYILDHEGDAYYFESESSRAEFVRQPKRFAGPRRPEGSGPR